MKKFLVLLLLLGSNSVFAQTQHSITVAEKRAMIAAFQAKSALKTDNVHAGTLTIETINRVLAQRGVDALRHYFGLDEQLRLQLVFVGASGEKHSNGFIVSPAHSTGVTLTEAQAAALVNRYKTSSLFLEYGKKLGGTMPIEAIRQLPKNTTAVRFYFGLDASGDVQIIWTPIVSDATLRLASTTADSGVETSETLLDRSSPCPPGCLDEPFR